MELALKPPRQVEPRPQFDLMVRCLELTASSNDHEALAAVRKANVIRETLGVSWADVVATRERSTERNSQFPELRPDFQPGLDYRPYFDAILKQSYVAPLWRWTLSGIETAWYDSRLSIAQTTRHGYAVL